MFIFWQLERLSQLQVEGRELGALERLQIELAAFVEKEMKDKFNNSSAQEDVKRKESLHRQTIEQRLKVIVEKAIRANYETSAHGKDRALSVAFVEAAQRSAVFQPKVVVDRLSPELIDKFQVPRSLVEKRPSHLPAKLQDYISGYSSGDSKKSQDFKYVTKTGAAKRENRTYAVSNDKGVQGQSIQQEMHMCGLCGITCLSRQVIEEHVKIHQPKNNEADANTEKNKHMRCKRCHAVVEARFVKMHVCSNRQSHTCNVCQATFRTEKLLISHLDTHQVAVAETELQTQIK